MHHLSIYVDGRGAFKDLLTDNTVLGFWTRISATPPRAEDPPNAGVTIGIVVRDLGERHIFARCRWEELWVATRAFELAWGPPPREPATYPTARQQARRMAQERAAELRRLERAATQEGASDGGGDRVAVPGPRAVPGGDRRRTPDLSGPGPGIVEAERAACAQLQARLLEVERKYAALLAVVADVHDAAQEVISSYLEQREPAHEALDTLAVARDLLRETCTHREAWQ